MLQIVHAPTTTFRAPLVFRSTSYEQVRSLFPVTKFTKRGLPVYHAVYGYGFVPMAALPDFFGAGTDMVVFTSKSAAVKKLGGTITVAKLALLVDHTHETFPAFLPAIRAAGNINCKAGGTNAR
jgi:hypothetical protein